MSPGPVQRSRQSPCPTAPLNLGCLRFRLAKITPIGVTIPVGVTGCARTRPYLAISIVPTCRVCQERIIAAYFVSYSQAYEPDEASIIGDLMTRKNEGKKHILVVNDDLAILDLFQELLGEEGYDVTLDNFARLTGELLLTIRELQPDLVIMDFIIGSEDSGWQLLQASRMDRSTRDIPVIVCTGAVKQVTELGDHLDGMGVRVVTKPFDIDHLIAIIDKVWESQGARTPELGLSTALTSRGQTKSQD